MGCCYIFRLDEGPFPSGSFTTVDVYCKDIADCLIAQGYDPRCVKKNSNSASPIGQARVHFDCEVYIRRYATVTTQSDCGNPPPPPGPGWVYAGICAPCIYGGPNSLITNPDGDTWSWRITLSACIAFAEFVNKENMLANILSHCLLDCAVPKPIDMDLLEMCFSDNLKESEGDATGGLLVCFGCTAGS
jgi:hypothetical protein